MSGYKKNILFFGELPPTTVHGASISSAINLRMLSKEFNITVVDEFFFIKNHNSGSLFKFFLFFKSFLKLFLKLFIRRYDFYYGVIYLSTFGILKNVFSVLLFRLFNPRSKVILHFHRSDFLIFLEKSRNRFLFKMLNIFVCRYVLLSKSQISDFENVESTKFYILSNTIQTEFEAKNLDLKNTSNDKCLNLIYVGNYIREKGIIELIKAVQVLNENSDFNFKMKMFGVFASQQLEFEVLNLLAVDKSITVSGPIYDIDKINEIANSDLLILPSYNEGLPIVLLESMSVGTPVVITPVGYIVEALGNEYPLYCKPKDMESIVDAVLKYLTIKKDVNLNDFVRLKYNNYSQHSHYVNLLKIFNFENINNNGCL